MIQVYIASDHAGIELKSKIVSEFQAKDMSAKFEIHDLGPQSTDSVDYPDYADLVCKKMHGFSLINVHQNENKHTVNTSISFPHEIGILICGSGQGMAMRANKFAHIRAALCWNVDIARLSREHNDANVLCLGAKAIDHETCIKILHQFISTPFAGGRHRQRVVKLSTPV
jgi:ribose 5-phosphate isomerase B